MNRPSIIAGLLGFVSLAATATSPAQDEGVLQAIDDALFLQTEDGFFQLDVSGLVDAEYYAFSGHPPGLIFFEDDDFNARLSVFLDATLGNHLYGFVQARLDRGFDPGSLSEVSLRG